MTVCKFYAKGFCKFGDRCRFEHVKQSQGGSRNQNRPQYEDNNYYESNRSYVKPAQFQNNQQQENYSSPFNRPNQASNFQNREKNDRYHWTPTSNRFTPLSEVKSDAAPMGGSGGNEDQATIKTIQDELTTWLSSGMWPYSCYSAGKETTCIEGLADIQAEELRTLFYLHGADTYKQIMREVDGLYSTRKQELIQMSDETRSAVLNNIHFSGETNPSSCLTIYSMYGPGVDFKPGSKDQQPTASLLSSEPTQFEAFSKPLASSTPAFQQATATSEPGSTTQPSKSFSLFKPDSSAKLTTTTVSDDVYTNEDILTEPERIEFRAESFTLGKIPMRPPPKSYCR